LVDEGTVGRSGRLTTVPLLFEVQTFVQNGSQE
jgi:hypothetical protein